jgi:hypothetical protein
MQIENALPMACPLCGKRAFDTSALPGAEVAIQMKCPHCGMLVCVPLASASILRRRNIGGESPIRLTAQRREAKRKDRERASDGQHTEQRLRAAGKRPAAHERQRMT